MSEERDKLFNLCLQYGYTEEDLKGVSKEYFEEFLKKGNILEFYEDLEEVKTYFFNFYGFLPPENLLIELLKKGFDPLCPYFETTEREELLSEVARYLGFAYYPANYEATDDFYKEFTNRLVATVEKEGGWTVSVNGEKKIIEKDANK